MSEAVRLWELEVDLHPLCPTFRGRCHAQYAHCHLRRSDGWRLLVRMMRMTTTTPTIKRSSRRKVCCKWRQLREKLCDIPYFPGFTGPMWRNTALAIAAIYGVAKFASSEEDEEPWLTRVLSANTPSVKEWVRINEDHLAQSEQRAGETLTAQTAQPPVLKRHTKPL